MDLPAHPKPGQLKRKHRSTKPRALIIVQDPTFPGGERRYYSKTKTGVAEYKRHTERVWIEADGLCCICQQFIRLDDLSPEHPEGRGMNGSRRHDMDIKPAHYWCNAKKGSIRQSTINATHTSGENYANQ